MKEHNDISYLLITMNNILNKFAWWLWLKTYKVTATEVMLQEHAKLEFNRRCWKCGERIYPILEEQKNRKVK